MRACQVLIGPPLPALACNCLRPGEGHGPLQQQYARQIDAANDICTVTARDNESSVSLYDYLILKLGILLQAPICSCSPCDSRAIFANDTIIMVL